MMSGLGGGASRASCCTGAHPQTTSTLLPQLLVSTSSSRAAMYGCALSALHRSAWLRGPERPEIQLHCLPNCIPGMASREGASFYLAQRHSSDQWLALSCSSLRLFNSIAIVCLHVCLLSKLLDDRNLVLCNLCSDCSTGLGYSRPQYIS